LGSVKVKVYERLKRAIDVFGSLLGLVIFFPVFLIAALIVRIDSPGPIVFIQKRVGKDGKVFGMYKLRSMVDEAEEHLKRDPNLLKEYKKGSYKLENDPRITRVGKILRKTSVDEIPQILNILRGEMSLIGPRAFKPDELGEQQRRFPEIKKELATALTVKPGLTGLWQVSGRSEIDFKERVKLDADYARSLSFWEDLKILIRTPFAVIKANGAY
jgi:lipopolysaccharide/colanic/teichoic acid biosynthesis glycosyltransferase